MASMALLPATLRRSALQGHQEVVVVVVVLGVVFVGVGVVIGVVVSHGTGG